LLSDEGGGGLSPGMMWLIPHTQIFFPVLLLGLVLMVEFGFFLRRAASDRIPDMQSAVEAARDGLAVLMGLLLGFSMPMALPHYERQFQLVAEEADAITTVEQRVQLYPEPARTAILSLLPEYVDARLAFADSRSTLGSPNNEAIENTIRRAESLQTEMWQLTAAQARQTPNAVALSVTQAVGALSDMIDERSAADQNRIPGLIWAVFLLISSLTCFVVGYAMQRRIWLSVIVFPLMAAIVLSLTAELDYPREGLVRINQSSMLRVQQNLKQMPTPTP
jgi:Protein of unknown function (DUF4239)